MVVFVCLIPLYILIPGTMSDGTRHVPEIALDRAIPLPLFLRGYSRREVPELDRRVAPVLAVVALAIVSMGFACFWLAYRLGLDPGRA